MSDFVIEPTIVEFDIVPDDIVATEFDVAMGLPGPTGNPGIVKVNHGSNPSMARPAATIVYWVGTVQPLNAHPDDLLMLT